MESVRRPIEIWDAWPEEARLQPALRALEGELLAGGSRVSALCASDTAFQEGGHLAQIADEGAEVRVSGAQLPEVIILDRRIAILRPHDGRFVENVLVIRNPSIVTAMCNTFAVLWQSAVAVDVFRNCGLALDDETTVQVLELLDAGCKDEAAARKLQMSVRTYRRHVARVMENLGADSRFQAGALAHRMGLLHTVQPRGEMRSSCRG